MLLTIDQLTKELQISESSIYRLIRAGLPHFKIGRAIRFDLDRVNDYLVRFHSGRVRLVTRKPRPPAP